MGSISRSFGFINWVIMWIGHRKERRRWERYPFVGANRGIVGCTWFIYRQMELKCLATGWMRCCRRLSIRYEGVLGNDRLVVSMFRRCITFAKSVNYAVDDFGWGTGETMSDLEGALESRYFSTVRMKWHVLHCARAHIKVPGRSIAWNALLTKIFPIFVSFKWN